MDQKQRMGLKGLLANKNKGVLTSTEVLNTQVTPNLPPPPLQLPTDLGLKVNPNLKKRRPIEDLEEGEVAQQKGAKQQKKTKDPEDRRSQFVDSQGEVEVR